MATSQKGRETPPLTGPATPADLLAILGGKEYTISPRPIKATREWKEQAEPIIDELMKMIANLPTSTGDLTALATGGTGSGGGGLMSTSVADMLPILMDVKTKLLYATDTVLELVCSYSPVLAADREWIEDNAYEAEIVYVFGHILKLVFPLESLKRAFRGEPTTGTPSSLPNRNGAIRPIR